MDTKPAAKKVAESSFVQTMLQSAQENKKVKPQTRFDQVNPAELDNLMAQMQRGKFRK